MKKHALIIMCIIILFPLIFSACGNSPSNAENQTPDPERSEKTEYYDLVQAKNATDKTAFDFEERNGEITVTGLSDETLTEVIIPSKIDGKPVTAVSDYAFSNHKNLRILYVPASVKSIGYGFLNGCSALSSLVLPFTGNTHKIKAGKNDHPFGYIFGETPYSGGRETMQFYHKDDTESVEMVYNYIPESLKTVRITGVKNTHIPYGTFYNCIDIDKIILGREVTDVGAFAFSGVVGEILWEDPQITVVGEHAFEDFKGEKLTIPESVTTIKRSAYSSCVNVKDFVIPDSVTKTDIYAFAYCYALENVTIGKNLKILPVETFYFCINLKTVSLPEKLLIIEDGAFDSCKVLERIEIPLNVTRINANAFKNCTKLKTVVFKDPDGWRYYSIITSGDYFSADIVSNPATAAKYLTDTFRDYIWEKLPR